MYPIIPFIIPVIHFGFNWLISFMQSDNGLFWNFM
jgi:hypothetical protein